jgi:hypothetical protein
MKILRNFIVFLLVLLCNQDIILTMDGRDGRGGARGKRTQNRTNHSFRGNVHYLLPEGGLRVSPLEAPSGVDPGIVDPRRLMQHMRTPFAYPHGFPHPGMMSPVMDPMQRALSCTFEALSPIVTQMKHAITENNTDAAKGLFDRVPDILIYPFLQTREQESGNNILHLTLKRIALAIKNGEQTEGLIALAQYILNVAHTYWPTNRGLFIEELDGNPSEPWSARKFFNVELRDKEACEELRCWFPDSDTEAAQSSESSTEAPLRAAGSIPTTPTDLRASLESVADLPTQLSVSTNQISARVSDDTEPVRLSPSPSPTSQLAAREAVLVEAEATKPLKTAMATLSLGQAAPHIDQPATPTAVSAARATAATLPGAQAACGSYLAAAARHAESYPANLGKPKGLSGGRGHEFPGYVSPTVTASAAQTEGPKAPRSKRHRVVSSKVMTTDHSNRKAMPVAAPIPGVIEARENRFKLLAQDDDDTVGDTAPPEEKEVAQRADQELAKQRETQALAAAKAPKKERQQEAEDAAFTVAMRQEGGGVCCTAATTAAQPIKHTSRTALAAKVRAKQDAALAEEIARKIARKLLEDEKAAALAAAENEEKVRKFLAEIKSIHRTALTEYIAALGDNPDSLFANLPSGRRITSSIASNSLVLLQPAYDPVLKLLDKDNDPENRFKYFGAFKFAIEYKAWDFLKKLLEEKIEDINASLSTTGMTILHTIFVSNIYGKTKYTQEELLRLIQLICNHRTYTPATINAVRTNGHTPLDIAVTLSNTTRHTDFYTDEDGLEIVKFLVRKGAEIGKQTLDFALKYSTPHVILYLLKNIRTSDSNRRGWIATKKSGAYAGKIAAVVALEPALGSTEEAAASVVVAPDDATPEA